MIKDRLHSKRVLIVVDHVDNFSQLECINGKHDWFCPGSRIIITTRNKHLLDVHGVDEVKEFNYEESIEILSWYAFKKRLPKEDYKNLLDHAIEYAKGLSLALKVLGIFLFSKTIREWESLLMGHGVDPYLGLNKIENPSPMMNFITISYLFNCIFGFIL